MINYLSGLRAGSRRRKDRPSQTNAERHQASQGFEFRTTARWSLATYAALKAVQLISALITHHSK